MSGQCHIRGKARSYQGHIFVLPRTLVSFIQFHNRFDCLRGHFPKYSLMFKLTDGLVTMYDKVSLFTFLGKNQSCNSLLKIYLFQVFPFQRCFLL